MSIKRWITAAVSAVTLGAAFVVIPVLAHHSSTPFYDPDQRVEIEGPVTRFQKPTRLSLRRCCRRKRRDCRMADRIRRPCKHTSRWLDSRFTPSRHDRESLRQAFPRRRLYRPVLCAHDSCRWHPGFGRWSCSGTDSTTRINSRGSTLTNLDEAGIHFS